MNLGKRSMNGIFWAEVVCKDGFTMSVQASKRHYCTPTQDLELTQYTHLEVGFPSEEEELLMLYAESPETTTETIYGWVPVEVIERVIEKHGGMAERNTDEE